jgi:hypothetical protein
MSVGADPLAKLRWAKVHLERLQANIEEWASSYRDAVRVEPDHERRGNTAFYAEGLAPPPDDLSNIIGDCLQAMRNGLDHIAYALAVAHTNPLPDEFAESSEFPIIGDKDRKGRLGTGERRFMNGGPGGGMYKIRGLSPEAIAVIKGLQPYHRGHDYVTDPLWRLHELSVIDKHRLVHVVAAQFSGIGIAFGLGHDYRMGAGVVYSFSGTVDQRTLVGSLPLVPTKKGTKMHVKAQIPLDVAFGPDTPLIAGESVVRTLGELYNHIVGTVLPTLSPYLRP